MLVSFIDGIGIVLVNINFTDKNVQSVSRCSDTHNRKITCMTRYTLFLLLSMQQLVKCLYTINI